MRGGRGDRNRQVDVASRHQRTCSPLQWRDAGRNRHGRWADDEGQSAARPGGRRRLRRPEPSGQLRDRDGRGRAGLHHGEPRRALRCHAAPGGGRRRSPGPAGPTRPLAPRVVGRTTAARGDRSGADGVTAPAGARRAHVRPRSGGRRGGPEHAGPPRARSRPDGRHGRASPGARRAVRRPDRPRSRRWRTARRRSARDGDADVVGCAAPGRAGPTGRVGPPSAFGTRRPPDVGPAARAAGSDGATGSGRARRAPGGSRRGGSTPQGVRVVRTRGGARRRRPLGLARRGSRAHGTERFGEVDPAQCALGGAPADPWRGDRRRAGNPIRSTRPSWCATWDWCPRTRGSSSTARASGRNARRRTRCRACPRARPRRPSSGCCRACPPIAIPATCPRGSASPWLWRWSWRPRRRSCSSTSPRGDWTIRARIVSLRSCVSWPGTVTPSCWPPTMSSWRPASRTGPWSWPTARSSPTARRVGWSAIPRSSPPRCPRSWLPKNG